MKKNPDVVSPACQEIDVDITSYDDLPVWAILEIVEARLLNASQENTAEMIAAVRARLPKLDAADIAQNNPVMTAADWESYLEWEDEQKRAANWNCGIEIEEGW